LLPVGSLVAIAIDARGLWSNGPDGGGEAGERLESALLDSVTHDFRTPLNP